MSKEKITYYNHSQFRKVTSFYKGTYSPRAAYLPQEYKAKVISIKDAANSKCNSIDRDDTLTDSGDQ